MIKFNFFRIINQYTNELIDLLESYFKGLYLSVFNLDSIPRNIINYGIIFLILNFIIQSLISMKIESNSLGAIIDIVLHQNVLSVNSGHELWLSKFISFILGNLIFAMAFSFFLSKISNIRLPIIAVIKALGFSAFTGYIYFILSGIYIVISLVSDNIISNIEIVTALLKPSETGVIEQYSINLYLSFVSLYQDELVDTMVVLLIVDVIIFLVTLFLWFRVLFSILRIQYTFKNIKAFFYSLGLIFCINTMILLCSNYQNIKDFVSHYIMYDKLIYEIKNAESSSIEDDRKLYILTNILAEDNNISNKTRYSMYVYSILYEEVYLSKLLNLGFNNNDNSISTDINNIEILDKYLNIGINMYDIYVKFEDKFSIIDSYDLDDPLYFNEHLNNINIKIRKAHEQRKLINENDVDPKIAIMAKLTIHNQQNIIMLNLLAL